MDAIPNATFYYLYCNNCAQLHNLPSSKSIQISYLSTAQNVYFTIIASLFDSNVKLQ